MKASWWTLPGPADGLEAVLQSLRDGRQVVLVLPTHLPAGLEDHLKRLLGNDWPWYTLPEDPGDSPLDLVFDRHARDVPYDQTRSYEALVTHRPMHHRILSIRITDPACRRRWQPFLDRYRETCAAYGRAGPAQFLVMLAGDAATEALESNKWVRLHRWRGAAGRLDATFYAAQALRHLSLNPLKMQLAVATCAELALWDPAVTDRLAEAGIEALESPLPALLDIARRRGWHPETSPRWEAGQVDTFDGETLVHSAVHALQGDVAELDRRRWKAQVSVVFPFLELRRRDLIERAGDRIYAPYESNGPGPPHYVESIEDLEFTDLLDQLRPHFRPDHPVLEMIRRLRSIRNNLAHMTPVDFAELDFPFVKTISMLDTG